MISKKKLRFNILLMGKTGVGKSTLVNAIFKEKKALTGDGKPVTGGINIYEMADFPLTFYDTPGIELTGKVDERLKQQVSKLIYDQNKHRIHCVWYCISDFGSRFEYIDEEWIIDLLKQKLPVIVVITQTIDPKRSELLKFIKKLDLPVEDVIPVSALPYTISNELIIPAYGLERLLEVTLEICEHKKLLTTVDSEVDNSELQTSQGIFMSQNLSVEWLQNLLQQSIQKEYDKLKKPNILIIGRSGVGKSSLINGIFGKNVAEVGSGEPVTASYDYYSSPDVQVNIYDSAGWKGGSQGETQFFQDTKNFLNKYRTNKLEDYIHIIWYLVDAPSARFTDFDAKILSNALQNIPVIVIISKADIASKDQIDSIKNVISKNKNENKIKNLVDTIDVAASPLNTDCNPYGLYDVVSKTTNILPALLRPAFVAAQIVSLSEKEKEAKKAIKYFATTSFAVGFLPIPFSDIIPLITIESTLIGRIAVIYGFKPTYTVLAGLGGIIASFSLGLIGFLLADFLKFIPIVGTIAASLIDGTIAATFTAALGFSFSALFCQITKSIIRGEEVKYTTEESVKTFITNRFKQELERLKKYKSIEDYEPLENESEL